MRCEGGLQVNMLGISYTDAHLATGFGTHMARPIFRNEHREDMSEEEGVRLLEKCMRVLYYRDRGQLNKIQVGTEGGWEGRGWRGGDGWTLLVNGGDGGGGGRLRRSHLQGWRYRSRTS